MQRRLMMTSVAMLISFAFSSCREEVIEPKVPATTTVVTPGGTSNVNNSFFAKVDSIEFQETLFTAQEWNGIISITAAENSSFPSLGLNVPADITPGTYTFSQLSPPQSSYNVGTNWDDMYSAESNTGVLTITTHDESSDYISGTFSFTAIPNPGNSNTNSFEITEGEFSISY